MADWVFVYYITWSLFISIILESGSKGIANIYYTDFRLGSLRGGLEGTKTKFFVSSGDWSFFLVVVV